MSVQLPTIIWLDQNATDTRVSFAVKLQEYEHVQLFSNIDQFMNYINNHTHEKIILIVSGSLVMTVMPKIYDLSNILTIIVFCVNISAYTEWAMEYLDKLFMFDHEDDLLVKLWRLMEEYCRNQANLLLQKADQFNNRAQRLKLPCG